MTEATESTPFQEYTIPGETTSEETFAETVAVTEDSILVQAIQDTGLDMIHANLFGSFLICGTLVGICLMRGRYGS